MMKWRVKKDSTTEHDDIRHSLEILDSVLAEFDDCLETSWDAPGQSYNPFNDSLKNFEENDSVFINSTSNSFDSLNCQMTYIDGSTSHRHEQHHSAVSPPPVPKRSPATRLSEQNLSFFPFPPDDASPDAQQPIRAKGNNHNNTATASLSPCQEHVAKQQITLSSSKKHGDNAVCDNGENIHKQDKCRRCGHRFQKAMESTECTDEASPFLQRRQMFEKKFTETSQLSHGTNGSSFRIRKSPIANSEPVSLPVDLSSESGFTSYIKSSSSQESTGSATNQPLALADFESNSCEMNQSSADLESCGSATNQSSADLESYGSATNQSSVDLESDDIVSNDLSTNLIASLLGPYHGENCNCKERIRQLHLKFAETRRLLKLNKIKGLDSAPPTFVPPPPPTNIRDQRLPTTSLDVSGEDLSGHRAQCSSSSVPPTPTNPTHSAHRIQCSSSSVPPTPTSPTHSAHKFQGSPSSKPPTPTSPTHSAHRFHGSPSSVPLPTPTSPTHQRLSQSDGQPATFLDVRSGVVGRRHRIGDCPSDSLEDIADRSQNSTHDYSSNPEDEFQSMDSSIASSSSKLCNKCSSPHLSETIEDLPHLLPTDALNRPHLGLSYTLEEDLSPGVKELQQTSTPKSDLSSSPSLFRTKESSLSTFSHSASSLGYVSSQSDLELNCVPDKVPLTSFKSMTLPNGLDRSPFYSAVDEDSHSDKVHSSKGLSDYNDNQVQFKDALMSEMSRSLDLELKGSGATPLPPEKIKTKHFRLFSRKDKKSKKFDSAKPSPQP